MKVLVACEESQEVCKAFRALGHEAYSCDIQECSGGHPEWHIQEDVLQVLNPVDHGNNYLPAIWFKTMDGDFHEVEKWDLIIAHPPCTYLSNAGARWLWAGRKLNEERYAKGLDAKEFFMKFWNADCPRICIENPVPSSVYNLPKCTQFVQPYEYGHPYSKKTCLWLKGLPLLKPTEIIADHKPFVSSGSYSKSRSKTFPGIAKAMAEQWGRGGREMTMHGRLVEANAVKEQIAKWLNTLGEATMGQYYLDIIRCIDDTPTVIEEEEVNK